MFTFASRLGWVLTLVFVALGVASPKSALKGLIADSEGAVIRGARVLVRWDQSGAGIGLKTNVGIKQDLILETDERGEFTAELPPGFYDVFVSANAFSPECRKVRIKPGETVVYKAKLKADALVTKEIGDLAEGTGAAPR